MSGISGSILDDAGQTHAAHSTITDDVFHDLVQIRPLIANESGNGPLDLNLAGRDVQIEPEHCSSGGHQPPVTDMCRASVGDCPRRAMTKSCPRGFRRIALSIASFNSPSDDDARTACLRST
jgi:hypothetical protein